MSDEGGVGRAAPSAPMARLKSSNGSSTTSVSVLST